MTSSTIANIEKEIMKMEIKENREMVLRAFHSLRNSEFLESFITFQFENDEDSFMFSKNLLVREFITIITNDYNFHSGASAGCTLRVLKNICGKEYRKM